MHAVAAARRDNPSLPVHFTTGSEGGQPAADYCMVLRRDGGKATLMDNLFMRGWQNIRRVWHKFTN